VAIKAKEAATTEAAPLVVETAAVVGAVPPHCPPPFFPA